MPDLDWLNRHKNFDPKEEEEEKRIYGLSSDEAWKAWRDRICSKDSELALLDKSKIQLHIAEKWYASARLIAYMSECSYEVFCKTLVEWRILDWSEIKRIDQEIWSEKNV